MSGTFEVYEDAAGKHRFRLKASNGQTVAVGEAYETRAAAVEGCAAVTRAADGASVVEVETQG
ncbi:MAG: DUF1508 domain-containing protein [Actinobacteria bacterium]|uniref:Unannotated protein n=1 Tax=freshwater metagenome TaxID=449393 RepID=A0A6J7EFV0_9ZZZZ|nr:DUF1508 domain-containing protein [Actinomycetota bacterium]